METGFIQDLFLLIITTGWGVSSGYMCLTAILITGFGNIPGDIPGQGPGTERTEHGLVQITGHARGITQGRNRGRVNGNAQGNSPVHNLSPVRNRGRMIQANDPKATPTTKSQGHGKA